MSQNKIKKRSVTNISAWFDNEADISHDEAVSENTQVLYEDFKTIDEALEKVIETPQASTELADKIKFQCLGRINPEQYRYEPKSNASTKSTLSFLSYFSRAAIVLLSAGLVYMISNKQEEENKQEQLSHHEPTPKKHSNDKDSTPQMRAPKEIAPVATIQTVKHLKPVENLDQKLEQLVQDHQENNSTITAKPAIIKPKLEALATAKFTLSEDDKNISIPSIPKMPNTYKQFWLVDSVSATISEIHQTLPDSATIITLDKINKKVSHITIHLLDDSIMDLVTDLYRKGATLVSDNGPHPLKTEQFQAKGNFVLYTFQLVEK